MVSTTETCETTVAAVEAQQPEVISTEEDFEKAQKLFQQGKKNLLLNKFDESVANLADACKTYAAKFGEMDPRCAEVYFFYGSALLELARIENTVLGNALTGVPEESEPINDSRYGNPEEVAAEEKEDIAEKVIDAMTETPEEVKAEETKAAEEAKAATEETKSEEVTEKKEETATAETTTTTTTTTTDETKKGEEEAEEENGEEEEEDEEEGGEEEAGEETGEKEKEEGEDVSNLQMSWEMFELAKVIYSKETDADKKKRVAECMMKLGEIGIEQELYTQAIEDITESIRMQEEAAERDERMLAESYYQLGMARQFNNMFAEANESYQRSINIVQLCIDKLKGKLATLEQAENKSDVEVEMNSWKDEIGELEALLPEMQSKLEEVSNEQRVMTEAALKELKESKEIFTTNAGFENGASNNGGDVKDITCMVKSKRKIDSCDETSTKKTRLSGEGEEETTTTTVVEQTKSDDDKENKIDETPAASIECTTTAPVTTTTTTDPEPITA